MCVAGLRDAVYLPTPERPVRGCRVAASRTRRAMVAAVGRRVNRCAIVGGTLTHSRAAGEAQRRVALSARLDTNADIACAALQVLPVSACRTPGSGDGAGDQAERAGASPTRKRSDRRPPVVRKSRFLRVEPTSTASRRRTGPNCAGAKTHQGSVRPIWTAERGRAPLCWLRGRRGMCETTLRRASVVARARPSGVRMRNGRAGARAGACHG
jgi:hypothetical protein